MKLNHINTFEIKKNIFSELENYNTNGIYINKEIIENMKSKAFKSFSNSAAL